MTDPTPRVLLAPSADLARGVLTTTPVSLTVEAEYGSYVAEGAFYTAAHHQGSGPFMGRHLVEGGRPSPCNDTAIPVLSDGEIILLSHLDLDSIGGTLRAMGGFKDIFPATVIPKDAHVVDALLNRAQVQTFWDLAEFIDCHGAHKLGVAVKLGATRRAVHQIYAYWAWSKSPEGGPRLPRDQVSNVTDTVIAAGSVLRRIFNDDADLLAAGDAFRAEEQALNERSFNTRTGDVLVRVATKSRDFVNHLYADPQGEPAKAVACYNAESGSVTISLADPVPGVSCRTLVQSLWGMEAGGHDGIAGSPRERFMTEAEFGDAVRALVTALTPCG